MILNISDDIHSLTEFKTNTPVFQKKLRRSGRAMVLTVNGHAELAVMSASTFQRVLEALDLIETLQGISEGMNEIKTGLGLPLNDAVSAIRSKLKIPVDA